MSKSMSYCQSLPKWSWTVCYFFLSEESYEFLKKEFVKE